MSPLDQFRAACEAAGLVPGEIIADGGLHRCGTVGKERGQDGAYLFHADSPASGWYQNYRSGQSDTWTNGDGKSLSPSEADALKRRIEADRQARQEEERQRHAEARARAKEIWNAAQPCPAKHPYLERKGIQPHDVRKGRDGQIIVSVLDEKGTVMSLQFIGSDGQKRFLAGGPIRGGYFAIRGKDIAGKLFVCEGFATGSSIHEATGATVLVAFDCGNLEAVAVMARRLYPKREIIVCADDDRRTEGNPGITKATKAAREAHALLAVPRFADPDAGGDFNDLHAAEGLEAVKACLDAAMEPKGAKEPDQIAQTLPLLCAANVKPEPVNWIWPGYLAGGVVHVFDGVPGVGKSMLSCYLAAVITTGTAWPDGTRAVVGNVVMVNLEDDLSRTLRPRLGAAGANLDRVFMFDDSGDGFTLPGDLARLEASIAQHQAKLVTIDPLMAVLDGKVNSYRDQDVRRVLAALKALCGRTGCAVALIRHLTKAAGGPAIHRGGGSIGIIGAARVGLLLAMDPKDDTRRILATVKNNLGPFDPKKSTSWIIAPGPRLEYAGTVDTSADDLLAEHDEKRSRGRPEKRSDASAWAIETLADGPMPSSMFYKRGEAAGFKDKTIRRACKDITETVKIAGTWYVKKTSGGQDGQKSIYKDYCPPSNKHIDMVDNLDGQKPFVQDGQLFLSTLNGDDCPDEVTL